VLLGRDEVYVLHGADEHVKRRRYVHYLWSAWQLQRQHPHAQFLLDTRLWDYRDIVDRVFSSQRIFNSEGVVELVLLLYTQDGKQKPKFGRSRGGLRHLIRVLEQLERTYDVYGMETEALLRILPADFDRWRPDRSPAVPATPERVARRPWERFHIGIRSRGNRSQNPE